MKDRSHDEAMTDYFRANPAYAEALLSEVRSGGDPAEWAVLLRQLQGEAGKDSAVTVSATWSECE
ncbi:hypothetical protein IMF27_15830 [Pseudomonas sp. PCH199]|uniref:hypothetical protein n=1 Tax=unclassified Pseudomonas TaxID=196821 RepID=UPI000BD9E1D7|nr:MULTISPECIES: hypothetical protein [unclassified Pseudomonas]MCW8276966.1 hypothetical protein [Pseudomonas sp. PCH199]PAM82934.1 hypothetical protein CES87_16150 [Pseudomonas sp. ERMR1:02]